MTPTELNRDLINKLSMNNPDVYHFLTAYAQGSITYEQALIGMVATLVNRNNELSSIALSRILTLP